MKNGGVIETAMCWEETGRVYYVKCYDSIEITINLDKKDVKKIIKEDGSDQAYQKEKPAWDKKRQEPERGRIEKDKEAKNAKDDRKIYVQKEKEAKRVIEKHLHQSQQSMTTMNNNSILPIEPTHKQKKLL